MHRAAQLIQTSRDTWYCRDCTPPCRRSQAFTFIFVHSSADTPMAKEAFASRILNVWHLIIPHQFQAVRPQNRRCISQAINNKRGNHNNRAQARMDWAIMVFSVVQKYLISAHDRRQGRRAKVSLQSNQQAPYNPTRCPHGLWYGPIRVLTHTSADTN